MEPTINHRRDDNVHGASDAKSLEGRTNVDNDHIGRQSKHDKRQHNARTAYCHKLPNVHFRRQFAHDWQ